MSDTNIDEVTAALIMAAGGQDKHVIGAEQLARVGTCLFVLIKGELQRTPHIGGQQYGSVTQLATRYGKSVNTLKVWARQLEADGMIKPLQGAPDREGAKGDTLYSFAEFDEALRERRERWNAKMND